MLQLGRQDLKLAYCPIAVFGLVVVLDSVVAAVKAIVLTWFPHLGPRRSS